VTALAAQDGAEDPVPAAIAEVGLPAEVLLGARFEIALEAVANAGGALRLYGAFPLDPAFVLERTVSEPATADGGTARLLLQMRACGSGTVPFGPLHVALHEPGVGERTLATKATSVEVVASWRGDPPAPFEAWRLVEPLAGGAPEGSWTIGATAAGVATVLLLAIATMVRRNRRRREVSSPIARRRDRGLLLAPWPTDRAGRRRHCFALHEWLRAELASIAPSTAWPWVASELLAAPQPLALDRGRLERLTGLLSELEHAMYSEAGVDAAAADVGQRLAELFPEREP
jgi:hypothetical protein